MSFKLFGPHPPPIHTPSITFFLAVRPFFITFNFGVRGKRITFFQKISPCQKIPPENILCEKRKFVPAAHYCGQIKAQRNHESAPQAKNCEFRPFFFRKNTFWSPLASPPRSLTPSTSHENLLPRLIRSPTFSVSGPRLSHAKIAMDGVWMGGGWVANNLNRTLSLIVCICIVLLW